MANNLAHGYKRY